uniref:Uncharacterized protein n=1 Tax=Corethron hystrix TaxID=216773 RepID=A0A7S1BNU1_9STRA|mmetsp:Transcript_35655/g.82934  ORF Transcript_35655/g.82934 Transcript_35655/m.82934 type:complete len:101 (+) Transcript_35655:188-490(+)
MLSLFLLFHFLYLLSLLTTVAVFFDSFRDYLQVVAIIGGTAIVSMDKSVSRKFIEKLSFSFHHLYFSEVILQLYTFLWRKEKWNRQQHCWSIFHHSFSYL